MTALNQHIGTAAQPFYRATTWRLRWVLAGDYSAAGLQFIVTPQGSTGVPAVIEIDDADAEMTVNYSAPNTTIDIELDATLTNIAPSDKYAYTLADTDNDDVLAEGRLTVSWSAYASV